MPNAIEHADPGGGELHEPQLVADRVVVVEVEARAVGVERLGAVDVGDGHVHELELEIDHESQTTGLPR